LHILPLNPLHSNSIGGTSDWRQRGGIALAEAIDSIETSKQAGHENMRVKFVLTMEDLVVDDQTVDQVTLDWEENLDQQQILELSHSWITSKNFLTQRMEGLIRVGESSLTIEPLEETEDAY
jgi:hypothetical protein